MFLGSRRLPREPPGASWGLLGVSWEALGGFLEASWGFRGSSRRKGKEKVMQESLQMRLGAVLGPSWDSLGTLLGPSGGRLGAILGPSWGHLGPSSAILGDLEGKKRDKQKRTKT